MGIKRERAHEFRFFDSAFDVPRDVAIQWLNGVLELEVTEVEQIAERGAEWCQLLHYCTIPEKGIIDLDGVHFGAKLTPNQVEQNYETFVQCLRLLEVQCPYLTDNIPQLISGSYSESIDLLHWMKSFVEFMGKPMYYSAKNERTVILKKHEELRAKEESDKAEQRAAEARQARRGMGPGSRSRLMESTQSRRTSMIPRAAGTMAPPRTAPRTAKPAVPRSGSVRSQGHQASTRSSLQVGSRNLPTSIPRNRSASSEHDVLKSKILSLETELQEQRELAETVATNFDKAWKGIHAYFSEDASVPDAVKHNVAAILRDSMRVQ
eukprot:TRINITY_DN11492_c0_g1_i1.p1 TRINITY_DN11492_c0_g1~~TRINITY_DN11492_c0_g1_i1.p1  ORF type:complete len:322 (+),score=74.35 TRINITY_DN11492_c0_g1_i1:56-1021(+)